MKKILVVTPRFPFDLWGACEQDRSQGIIFLKRLGYDVRVITMCYERQLALIPDTEKKWEVTIIPVLYSKVHATPLQKLIKRVKQVFIPLYWDGAAYEYREREIQKVVSTQVEDFKPDLVWFDYSYLWPLYHIVKRHHVPIITRSINYEPSHYFEKSKKTIIDRLKYLVKVYGERRMLKLSDAVFSITPKEKITYERLGGNNVTNLPLRRLGSFIGKNAEIHNRKKLQVCFMGSNYSVHHMLQGLRFILEKVNPLLQEKYPDTFDIHIIGGKVPKHIVDAHYPNVTIHGYVPDLDAFLADMDIALSPSLSGEGMQQKVFEPVVRGIPTITSPRALAGYSFFDGIHLLTVADAPEAFVLALGTLTDMSERRRLSQNAIHMAQNQFTEELLAELMDRTIKKLLSAS